MTSPTAEPVLVSIDRAMESFPIPLENREFIRNFVARVGVKGCLVVGHSYIRALRTYGQRDLNIASGWSNGFVDEAEALALTGGNHPVWHDNGRPGTWGVSHPLNWIRDGSGVRGATAPRDFGRCMKHGQPLLATGNCWQCDGES